MSGSPKKLARQNRRQARSSAREDRRNARTTPVESQFMNEHTYAPPKARQEPVVPLTERQADYEDAIAESRVTFGIGPAGTGKTYFATRKAAEALHEKRIKKIYLTRPAVEAGERLGFLPGDVDEKYEPYLRPFKDALIEFFGEGHLDYLIKRKIIEPVPLGFLRGSTIKNAWLIADEMQNATKEQMKMLLTRIGKGSKFVINGDPKQADICGSGLMDSVRRTMKVEGISHVEFTRQDVVRDDIVQDIIAVYEDE